MKKVLMICWLVFLFSAICGLFWYQEWRYSLPTPVPIHYSSIGLGSFIDLSGKGIAKSAHKPVFIHFFNPHCPCSKFNLPHFKALVKKYGNDIDFSVVVFDRFKTYTPFSIKEKYDLSIPVSFDTTVAALCGVYATPQAVLLDANHRLYYKGNYNRNRYCTDAHSDYAQMAIYSLLEHKAKPCFSQYALKAYGCQLSYCNIDSLTPPK